MKEAQEGREMLYDEKEKNNNVWHVNAMWLNQFPNLKDQCMTTANWDHCPSKEIHITNDVPSQLPGTHYSPQSQMTTSDNI